MSSEDRLKAVSRHIIPSVSHNNCTSLSCVHSVEKHLCTAGNNGEGGVVLPINSNQKNLSSKQNVTQRVRSAIPKFRQELLKWNGWGYKDSQFTVDTKDSIVRFTGQRYAIGELTLPYFTNWVLEKFGLDVVETLNESIGIPKPEEYPVPTIDSTFLGKLRALDIAYSLDGMDRLVRSHGHTLHDIYMLRKGQFGRIPDIVCWPDNHDEVVRLVMLADAHNVVIMPFGGGTSVSGGVSCPPHELRTIVALDTSQMNRIMWVDPDNLVACVESGIIGQDLEREMQSRGFTVGHEPDSYEFSSLGGWVATRASGMKKNIYGNIEDLLVHVRMATPQGVLEKGCRAPRMSTGPDFNHIVLGSEGTLGVVTEVTLKIRPLPAVKKFGSLVFPNFEAGVACMREVALQRCQPASIRLMDNEQFKFGQTLRPVPSYLGLLLDGLKRAYIHRIKGFDVDSMCVTTLLYEGDAKSVAAQEKKINEIAIKSGGIPAGETNGERGYTLTFVIAYIRDFALEHNIVAESFETSVPWDRTLSLCRNVKHRIEHECKGAGIERLFVSCRVTQTYDAGCCVYFYFGFLWTGLADPLATYEYIEEMARDEVLASGGSLSHHHGVGKLRAKWLPAAVSPLGMSLYRATKQQLDPNNIFANGNLNPIKSNL